jgi:hypothetical protein
VLDECGRHQRQRGNGEGASRDPESSSWLALTFFSDTVLTWGAFGSLFVALLRLRGKDSNLDYLIQSQASYH